MIERMELPRKFMNVRSALIRTIGGTVFILALLSQPRAAWVPVDNNGAYKAFCMAAAPHVNRVYFEMDKQALYVTTNNGTSWTPLSHNTTNGKAFDASILQVTFDPADTADNTFWAGGTYGSAGLYYTKDGGQTWLALCFNHTQNFAIDFTDPERKTILASSHTGDFFRSTDGGVTCTSILDKFGTADTGITSGGNPFIIDTKTFVARCGNGAGWAGTDGILRSTDGGDTWTRVLSLTISQQILVNPIDGSWIGCLPWSRGLIRSTDKGLHWLGKIGYGTLESGAESICGTFLPDGRYVHIKMMTTSGNQQLMISTNYVTFTNFLDPFPATGMNLADQCLGVVYSKPGNMLYTYTRYGKISRSDVPAAGIVRPEGPRETHGKQPVCQLLGPWRSVAEVLAHRSKPSTVYDIRGRIVSAEGIDRLELSGENLYIVKGLAGAR
jgi:hypothetical protein